MKLDIYIVEYYNDQEHKTYFGSIEKHLHETKEEFENRCDVRLADIMAEASELGRSIYFNNRIHSMKREEPTMTMIEKLTAVVDRYDVAIHKLSEGDMERQSAAHDLINTINEAKKAETKLIEKMHVDLITAAGNVNRCADEGDTNRNRVNYGIATKCAEVLRLLGLKADCPVWEDNGFLRIPRVTINGKTTEYHNGK